MSFSVGERCDDLSQCVSGLACADGFCVPCADAAEGSGCGAARLCHGSLCVAGCFVDGAYVVDQAVSAGNACHSCQPALSTLAWSNVADGTACGPGDACKAGACLPTGACVIGGAVFPDGEPNPDNACQLCDFATASTAWSASAAGETCPDDGNPCTDDACDGAGVCRHTPSANGTGCGAGLVCVDGACKPGCGVAPGPFDVTGVTGNLDVVADAWLTTTLSPTARWQSSSCAATYEVVIRDAADTSDACGMQTSSATSLDFSPCTLVNGTSYRIKVTARNVAGIGTSATNDGFLFTVDAAAPGPFTISGLTGGADVTADAWLGTSLHPTVSWSAATGATLYDVVIRDTADTIDVCAAQTQATIHDFSTCALADATTYRVKVTASDSAGNATRATNDGLLFTVDATPPTTPAFSAPGANMAVFSPSFTFTWSSVDTGSGLAVSNAWLVELFASAGCSGSPAASGVQTLASVGYPGMVPATTYSVRATAHDAVGNVSASACSPDVTYDPVPTVALADPTTGSPTLATHQTLEVTVGNDSGATRWCLSQTQATAPATGAATCTGGAGALSGWSAARPLAFTVSVGDGSKTVYLWLADATGHVNLNGAMAQIVLSHTPLPLVFDPTPVRISSLHKSATRLTGRCTEIGGAVLLSGDVAGSTTCAADQTWAVTEDFSAAADGTVTVFGVQWTASGALSSVPTARHYLKDTAFCDDSGNASASPFASGSGTSASPYLTCNAAQLSQLASFLDASVQLRNDVDLGGSDWSPVADSTNPFTGTLDGNGFVIENLTYTQGNNWVGLFSYLSGTIENLGVVNVMMVGGCHLGAIVGVVNPGGLVQSCYSTGVINSNSDSVGGLVGENDGAISRCYSSVTINEIGIPGNNYWVGGLVGHSSGSIDQSYATGNVSVGNEHDAGGLVGLNDGTVSNCYATGSVTGDSSSYNLGGLVGENDGPLQRSYSNGPVSGGSCCAGGLVATNGDVVTSCYWDQQTSGQATSDGGSGLSTAEMGVQASYLSWDFTNVWTFDPTRSAYPVLLWQ
jgi:hypothetical protein